MFNHHFHRSLIIVALVATTNLIGIATPVLAEDQQPARHHSLIHRQASDLRPLESATSTPPTATAPSTPAPRPLSRKLAKRPGHTTILGAAAEPPQTTSATALPATTETTKAGTSLAATGTALAGSSVAGVPAAASSASTTATLPLANVAPSTKSAAGAVGSTGTVSSRSLGSPATGGRGLQRLADQLPVSQMIAPTVTISSPSAPSAPRQSSAPSSSEPSTTLPPPPTSTSPGTGSAILSWTSNGEADLAGYKLYVGTAPGQYTYAGSPFVIGLMGSYTISGLPMGQTYYFALSAFDSSGNESGLSSEVSKSIY